MKRIHLFEFEDQPWFPFVVRDGMTDYLMFVANLMDFYKSVVPIIAKGLHSRGGNTIVDLASGGGGGWERLVEHLLPEFPLLQIVLTDWYPNALGRLANQNPAK